jgi:hypothetical protein
MTKDEIKKMKLINVKDIQSNKKVITVLLEFNVTISHSIK